MSPCKANMRQPSLPVRPAAPVSLSHPLHSFPCKMPHGRFSRRCPDWCVGKHHLVSQPASITGQVLQTTRTCAKCLHNRRSQSQLLALFTAASPRALAAVFSSLQQPQAAARSTKAYLITAPQNSGPQRQFPRVFSRLQQAYSNRLQRQSSAAYRSCTCCQKLLITASEDCC